MTGGKHQLDASSLFDLSNRGALVTGGSRGIGRMIAETLVRAGADVVITARPSDDLTRTANELATIGRCVAIAADLTDRAGIDRLADEVMQRHPSLHLVVNNAGAARSAPLGSVPAEDFDDVLSTNVTAPFLLTQALLPALRADATPADPARVIMVGSVHGILAPMIDNWAYSASKAAIHHLARHLAVHLAPDHVTVNVVAPGAFETRMTEPYFGDDVGRAAVTDRVPVGRLGSASDIAGAILHLAGPAGAYITGSVLPIDGGLTSRGGRS